MRDKSNQVPVEHDWRTERLLTLLILSHPEWCSRTELEAKLHEIDPLALSDALAKLGCEGVVVLDGEQIRVSRCVRHIDSLGLIGV